MQLSDQKNKLSATLILIIINLLVFILAYWLPNITNQFALYFPENPEFQIKQIVSYSFIHANFLHLFFNLFALWLFGNQLENFLGIKKFLILYFICGVGAAITSILVNYYFFNQYDGLLLSQSQIQENSLRDSYHIYHSSIVGASGAVYGILAAFTVIYPNTKLFLLFIPIPIKAKYFFPILLSFDLFFALTKYSIGNIAHFAHIGGGLFGLILILFLFNKKHSQDSHLQQ